MCFEPPIRPTVLVLSGLDPSGGAGITADVQAIHAQGAHALPVVTALTVQDNNRVHAVTPVDPDLLARQVQLLAASIRIDAVKLGIPGSRANAEAIAALLAPLRAANPALPIVLDPVLASGHGDALGRGDAVQALAPLLALATVLVPNGMEAAALGETPCPDVLVTGGHDDGPDVVNRWGARSWRWPRLPGEFHGSGCTLAAAIAGQLACGQPLEAALERAQAYTHGTLAHAFAIAPGQLIPRR
ncbi:MAG: hydroxymethylpyrimidine/phosphomethylpyrimidine kinase [Gammaproteobacteria bacterium]